MTDFDTVAREILGYPATSAEREEWAESALKHQDEAIAALVAAHEADKREELNKQLAVTFRELANEHDHDYGEDWVLGGKADYYEAQAALAGSDKPITPPTTPLRQNTPGGRL